MDTKKLADLTEDEVVKEIQENASEARKVASLLVEGAGLVARACRMKKMSDDETFASVFAQMAKTEDIDVTDQHGIVIAVVIAEFATRAHPA